jgi:anti-anti-sigma factor
VNVSSHQTTAGVVHVSVAGEIDLATAGEVERALVAALNYPDVTDVIVDLAGVGFCDSAGIEVFDRLYGSAADRDIRLRLVSVPPVVRRILEIACLLDTLTQP